MLSENAMMQIYRTIIAYQLAFTAENCLSSVLFLLRYDNCENAREKPEKRLSSNKQQSDRVAEKNSLDCEVNIFQPLQLCFDPHRYVCAKL